ncbi:MULTISPECIES: autoinducer 2 ABC transporter substrate-binding protein [Actinotignum]|uniref:Autoinducer 2 ABC transporter substrate-binding protein n=3 Tax=Actinotignum TaxID=1653174 RepID=A0AAW9HKZ6_9ACTO|nr:MULTISPECIES: autoinducer 2 ABC transporter substrate-binding protein [Actinotignum]MDY5127612.1 autoinducer 2 ABC transporter substrate-binding protein [Actinotignum sp. SLA_B059]MDY5130010.1 autoinducer 2 ABC transporter substrate-binding protein [Actinotignum timonense]MDY5140304.1 autoinducer 2 ABC transporter substrate-binding protein [Actinotignum timonense]
MGKKFWAAACATLVSLSLTACGGGIVGGGKNSGNDDVKNIVLVAKQEGIPWFDDMRSGVEKFGKDHEGKVSARQIAPDSGDPAKQAQMISDLLSQDVDAIVVVPNDPQALQPVIKQAREKGIVVISHEASNIAENVDYDIEAFDNKTFGEAFAENVAQGMGGKGQLAAVVGSHTMETHMAWYNAAVKYLEKNYPEIELVSAQPYEDNNDDAKARAVATEILNTYPDLKGFIGTSVSAGANMAAVLQERNNKNVAVSTLGIPSVTMPYIESGWVYYAQTWRPADAGYAACELALQKLEGQEIKTGSTLKSPGYESVSVDGQMVYGEAPLILKKGDFSDGKYPF